MIRRPTALALLAPLALWACAHAPTESPDVSPAARPEAPALDVVAVVSRPVETTAHLEGELSPYESVALYPRVTGFVASVPVDRGTRVHRGQLLVRLVAPELASQRAEAQARQRADQSTLDRLRAAAQTPGAVAGHDVELAQAAVDADRARVRSLQDVLQYLTVNAPFDGVVTERDVHPGALVGPSTAPNSVPMLRVEQVARLRLTVAVPEQLAGEIAEGARAEFTVRAWPQARFAGTIVRPSHTVDPRTRTMAVELDVDNADGRLAPGMFADVAWPVRHAAPSLLVPRTSVVQTTERALVIRVRDGAAEQVPVQRGSAVGELVEVFGALAAGDLVARRGNEELRNGTHVTPHVVVPDGGAAR